MKEVLIHISNGRIGNIDEFRSIMNSLKDGHYKVEIRDARKRSIPQNSYYWGVVIPYVKEGLREAGYEEVQTPMDAHEVLKHIHLRRRIVSHSTGDVIDIADSTAALKIPEFNDYIEKICRWSVEYLNVVIPSPNQVMIDFEQYTESIETQMDEKAAY